MIDTNVVLDLLHFSDPASRPILQALETGRIECRVTAATLDELRRVLAYPAFHLDTVAQTGIWTRYQALARCVDTPSPAPLPRCRDADDQKFIELASAESADVLVSRDRALLKLKGRRQLRFRMLAPKDAAAELAGARTGGVKLMPPREQGSHLP